MAHEKINMTDQDYSQYIEQKAEKSNIVKNIFLAFLVGGIICIIGKIINDIFLAFNFDKQSAATFSSVCLIFLGAFLTSVDLYSKLGKHAGAGSIVPITGFSNSIVATAIEYKSEGFILGLGANMFKIAGPVLVYGITSSVIIGFIYWIFKFF